MTIYLPKNTPGDFSTTGASSLLSKQLDNALKEHKKGSSLMYSEPKILTPFVAICKKEFKFKNSSNESQCTFNVYVSKGLARINSGLTAGNVSQQEIVARN